MSLACKLLGGHFDLDAKKNRIQELEEKLNDSALWQMPEEANRVNSELVNLQKIVSGFVKSANELSEYREIITHLNDVDLVNEIEINLRVIESHLDELEISNMLGGKYDRLNCYLEIHPGAGGTEACDWADMLARMYQMFCNKNNYHYEVLDEQAGDEAGIKSITMKITGDFAYGYFKGEQGVHRLVRISPFDSNARRHTSFASVSVIPEIAQEINVEIKPEDIRVDVYRSSGKGGQGVNTTDSAVRVTHLPTGIVVTCQNERSQIKNKDTAMKILTGKLFALASEEQTASINSMKSNKNIEFGSQIRNYTLEPYKLVKDTRTGYEETNADAVLNGNIMEFMREYLRIKR